MNLSEPRFDPLVKTPGTALHRQLFLVLREQIMRGVYAPGALLPNEDELCGHFGVSKITVRRALADLKQLGLVERQQGRGTFVSQEIPGAPSQEAMNFVQALERRGAETQVRVLDVRRQIPPGSVALQLKMASGEEGVFAARLRHVGDAHLVVTEAWVSAELGKGVTVARLRKRPLFELLQDKGVVFGRVIEEITAVTANPYYAKLLQTTVGMPLIRITRLVYGKDGRPVEHLTVHLNPERSRVLLNVPPGDVAVTSRIVHDLMI